MLIFRSTNPSRPPDWRWQMAKFLLDHNMRLTRSRGDALVGLAKEFANQMEMAVDDAEKFVLCERNPALFEAWAIYNNHSGTYTRWEMEARLLAGEDYDIIERKTNITTPGTAKYYHDLFFDVSCATDAPSYVANVVLGESFHRGVLAREHDILWKMFGYWGGPFVIDFLVNKFNNPIKPASDKGMSAFWRDDYHSQLEYKASMAMRTMKIDSMTYEVIVNAFGAMQTLEKDSGGAGGGGAESYKTCVSALINMLPWNKHKNASTGVAVIDQVDATGVGLRAGELLRVGKGSHIPDLDVIMSAQFPEEPKKS